MSGSGAPNQTGTQTNRCAMQCRQAACVFDVVTKFCTEATNLLKFCMAGSDGLDLALGAGGAGVGRI